MYDKFQKHISQQIEEIKASGTYKNERILVSPQYSKIRVNTGKEVLNFCANNYLGLANNPKLVDAAVKCLQERAYGMASVRFIFWITARGSCTGTVIPIFRVETLLRSI